MQTDERSSVSANLATVSLKSIFLTSTLCGWNVGHVVCFFVCPCVLSHCHIHWAAERAQPEKSKEHKTKQ